MKASFAAGCFWQVEAAFAGREGVEAATSGYTGGALANPTYEQVCSGTTGHAEAVEVDFDPDVVSYRELVDLFWQIHDPTQKDRQGPDIGSQYRSAIFTHDDDQARVARESAVDLAASGRFPRELATEIVPAKDFFRAEEYHQRYLEKIGRHR
jgi:peptide-methionine (S)-S-oxide reductase